MNSILLIFNIRIGPSVIYREAWGVATWLNAGDSLVQGDSAYLQANCMSSAQGDEVGIKKWLRLWFTKAEYSQSQTLNLTMSFLDGSICIHGEEHVQVSGALGEGAGKGG